MAVFRSPAKQAASVMRELQGTILKSVRTVENYERGLTRVTEWTQREKLSDGLRGLTREQAIAYLEQRGQAVGQKCLDMERQAIQAMFRHVTNKLGAGETLPVIKADQPQVLGSRAYNPQQVALICERLAPHNALATEIAYTAGLRAHELLTLQPRSERTPDPRPALPTKFEGREDGSRSGLNASATPGGGCRSTHSREPHHERAGIRLQQYQSPQRAGRRAQTSRHVHRRHPGRHRLAPHGV